MQNRYTGDVGDFGKYGLLRLLAGESDSSRRLRLGIIWCLYPDEGHNADGNHTSYLNDPARKQRRFAACDTDLYDAMRLLVPAHRRVSEIPGLGIFSPDTTFYDETLSFLGVPLTGRRAVRS